MLRKPIMIVILLIICSSAAGASNYVRVDQPELAGAVLLVDDVLDQGESQIIIGKGNEVHIIVQDEVVAAISSLPGDVTALAAGDLTGDFRKELVIGTDNAGAFYIYEYRNDRWQQFGRPRYLWDPVSFLEVRDINNDGWGDLLVANDQGEAQIFLSWQGELYSFWRSSPVQHITTADVDADGYLEVILTRKSGYVGVLKWEEQEFVLLWENYPWGIIDSMVVIKDTDYPEWMVITSQKMAYSWKWKNGEIVSNRHFYAPQLGELLTYVPGPNLLSFSRKTGASLYRLQASGVQELWNVPDVNGVQVYALSEGYLVRQEDNSYYWLLPGDGRWTVLIDGEEAAADISLLFADGSILCSLHDAINYLGMSMFGQDPWYVIGPKNYLYIKQGESTAIVDGVRFPLSSPVVVEQGDVYVPPDLFNLLGWTVEIDRSRQQIRFVPRWGWWR